MLDLKKLINQFVSEKDIMEYYYGQPLVENKPIYHNITRADRKGSCYFFHGNNGKYFLNDVAQRKCYDVYDVVQQIKRCSYADCLAIIANDMGLLGDTKSLKARKEEVVINRNNLFYPSFKFLKRNYDANDIAYWSKIGIRKHTLDKFETYPVQEIYFKKSHEVTYSLIYRYDGNNSSICYATPLNNRVKFYKPMKRHKIDKWLGNTNDHCIYGLKQLDVNKSDVVFITASNKSVMCLDQMGYSAIAPMSESAPLPDHVISLLQDAKSKGKLIVYLNDTDLTGLKTGTNFAIKNGFSSVWLPKIEGTTMKDLPEYCEYFGFNNAKLIIQELINLIDKDEYRSKREAQRSKEERNGRNTGSRPDDSASATSAIPARCNS